MCRGISEAQGKVIERQKLLCHDIDHLHLELRQVVKAFMGKRKKNAQNVVKVDLGDLIFTKSEPLPVLVQNLSKDGRRIKQTIHQIPAPQLNPPSLTFDPCPVFAEDEDTVFLDAEPPSGGGSGEDHVRSRSFPFFNAPDRRVDCSWIRFGYGLQTAILGFKSYSCWKGAWNTAMGRATFV